MGENSKIQWTHHTFNPWIGCAKVSAGCTNCYAEVDTFPRVQRSRGRELWGVNARRHVTSDANWLKPIAWNREAEAAGERRRVFCASMADVFEDRIDLLNVRGLLWGLVERCDALDWLLLTKRPENIASLVPSSWMQHWPAHVWIGTTVENQAAVGRVIHLSRIPAPVRFASIEPLLGPVELGCWVSCLSWVILGGESGPHARPCALEWLERIADECQHVGVKVFVKQLGAYVVSEERTAPLDCFSDPSRAPAEAPNGERWAWRCGTQDPKGGDIAEFPERLRLRQFPEVRA